VKRVPWIVAIVGSTAAITAAGFQQPGPTGSHQPPAATSTGVILGQIVDVGTGKPIPEATVTITIRGAGPAAGQAGLPGRAGGLLAGRAAGPAAANTLRLLTGADGRFVVHDLPTGVININAIASGYVQGAVGQARPTGPARPIDLDDGERLTDVKIRLWKHAVVTGTVVDENGEPSVGMTVRMLRQSMVNGKPKYLPGAQAKTDDRGVYRISAITPGTFLMVVPQTLATMPAANVDALMQGLASSAPQGNGMAELMSAGASSPNLGGAGFRVGDLMVSAPSGGLPPPAGDRLFVYQTLFHPAGAMSAQGTVVTLGSGEERSGIDFQLRVLPTLRVSGTVMGPAGPVSGAPVRLLPAGAIDFTSDNGIETATAMTAGDGTFQLLGVPSGQYTLSIVKPVSAPMPAAMASNPLMQFAGMGMSAAGQPVPLYAQLPLSVGNTDLTALSLMLTEGVKVSGRVEFVGTAPRPSTAQLQGMTAILTPADGRTAPVTVYNASNRVDLDAQFKTAGYPPGKYLATLSPAPAPNQWLMKSVTIGGRDVTDEGIDLKDSDIGDVVITYTDKINSITGNVRTPAGAPSATATVIAFPADYESWIASGMNAQRSRTAVATKKGAFTMTGLPGGDYLLAALDDADLGDPRDPQFLDAIARSATKITLSNGDQKSQDLRTVKGR
jgi:hypothetical protein